MTQKTQAMTKWFATILFGEVRRHRDTPTHVTKEEILDIFCKELPEPSPKR